MHVYYFQKNFLIKSCREDDEVMLYFCFRHVHGNSNICFTLNYKHPENEISFMILCMFQNHFVYIMPNLTRFTWISMHMKMHLLQSCCFHFHKLGSFFFGTR